MNKVKTVKIKNEDGSISEESYSIAADAINIDMANSKNVQETIGTIDVDEDGDIATQLKNKVNKNDIIDNLNSSDNNKVLSAKQGKMLGDAVAAANSDIKKKIYYFNNVADMKAADLQAGDIVQTLGYYEANDGGNALYKLRTKTNADIIDNMFILSLLNQNIIAELIIEDSINIKQLGSKGNNSDNNTNIFETAMNKLYNLNGGTIYIPNGIYKLDYLKLLPYVHIKGEHQNKTILVPSISATSKFMYMIKNPLTYVNYERFSIQNLNNINNLIGIDLTSLSSESSPYNGGLWYAKFFEVTVANFLIGIKLEAIDNNGDEANQFLNFEKVNIYRKGLDDNERCLVINEQLGQTIFDSCLFESTNLQNNGLAPGINVDIGSTLSIGDSDIACLLFNNCTFQNSLKNIKINARGVTIRDSWFENIGQNIELLTNSNLNLYNNRFANACYDGSGTGYIVKTGTQCYLKCYDNVVTGERSENFILGNRNTNMILIKNNSTSTIPSSQIIQQFGVDNNNSISTRSHNLVYINAGDIELKTINSTLSQGEELTIIVGGGSSDGKTLKITSGGNITVRSASPIILHNSDSITLTKQDLLGVTWWVKSVHKFKYYSDIIPSSNSNFASTYFLAGDVIYNSNKTSGQPIGWECITSGTPGTWISFGEYN